MSSRTCWICISAPALAVPLLAFHHGSGAKDSGGTYLGYLELAEVAAGRLSKVEDLPQVDVVRPSMNRWVDPGEFHGDIRDDYFGQPFTLEDVEAASAWLWRNGYIEGLKVHEFDGPVAPYLSDQGLDCVESFGADPRRYTGAKNHPRGGDTFHLTGDHTQASTGSNATQLMNVRASVEELGSCETDSWTSCSRGHHPMRQPSSGAT